MSTTVNVTTNSAATPPAPTKLQSILAIIQLALSGLSSLPVVGGAASLANVFVGLLTHGLNLYQQETGAPLDLTKIPVETLVP